MNNSPLSVPLSYDKWNGCVKDKEDKTLAIFIWPGAETIYGSRFIRDQEVKAKWIVDTLNVLCSPEAVVPLSPEGEPQRFHKKR